MRVAFLYNDAHEDPAGLAEDGDPERSPIVSALRQAGHDVTALACTLDLSAVRRQLESARPDVAFNRVESLGGSDALASAVPLLLDTLRLPYTGCTTSAILATVDKVAVKKRLVAAGLPTPAWITGREQGAGSRENSIPPCSLPGTLGVAPCYIVKSVLEHASFAIDDGSVVARDNAEQIIEMIHACEARHERPYFAEQFIDGREFNLAVLGDGAAALARVLPPAEIDFSAFPAGKPRIVGRGAKFDAESFEFENTPRRYDFPAADRALIARLTDLAAGCWRLFDLTGYARVDFRVDANGQPWILEINSNPCLAPGSGFAAAAEEAGTGYEDLIERILLDAVDRNRPESFQLREPTDEHAAISS